jgi:hypothetical protein
VPLPPIVEVMVAAVDYDENVLAIGNNRGCSNNSIAVLQTPMAATVSSKN